MTQGETLTEKLTESYVFGSDRRPSSATKKQRQPLISIPKPTPTVYLEPQYPAKSHANRYKKQQSIPKPQYLNHIPYAPKPKAQSTTYRLSLPKSKGERGREGEREREEGREREGARERGRERERVRVRESVCERECVRESVCLRARD